MRLVTIELSDRDAKWLETHEKEIVWLIRQSDSIVSTANIEKRVAAKVAKQLVFDNIIMDTIVFDNNGCY